MQIGFAAMGSVAALWPLPLWAHDAFGDLGPLYQALLHPLVDPLQAVLVVGASVFLARQPLPVVRLAYPSFVIAATASILATLGLAAGDIDPRTLAVMAATIGLLAAIGFRPAPVPTVALVAMVGFAAGSVVDPAQDLRGAALAVFGGAMGLAIAPLLIWGAAELAERRISHVAGAVVGGWVAAVGLMLAALPS